MEAAGQKPCFHKHVNMLIHFDEEPLQRLQFSFKGLSGGNVHSAGGPHIGIVLRSGRRSWSAAVTNLPHLPIHALAPIVVPAFRA